MAKRSWPLWATIFTCLGIFVLSGLGNWQLQRRDWKDDILQKLDAAYGAAGSGLLDFKEIDPESFVYGRVEGVFLAEKALLLGPRTRDRQIGHDVIVPLRIPEGTILVNMGWTAATLLEDLSLMGFSGKAVWFDGLARRPQWNIFTPDNDPAQDLWYKPDIQNIAREKGLPDPVPLMFYAEKASHAFTDMQGQTVLPNNRRWQPANNHQHYAYFWFIMAGVLAVIYLLRFMRKPKPA